MMCFQNQWSTIFCGVVSRAMTLDILSTGVAGNYNGALQVVCTQHTINLNLEWIKAFTEINPYDIIFM